MNDRKVRVEARFLVYGIKKDAEAVVARAVSELKKIDPSCEVALVSCDCLDEGDAQ